MIRRLASKAFIWMDKHWKAAWIVPFLASVSAFVWVYNKPPYLSYEGLPFEPTVPEVQAGQIVPIRLVRCNNTEKDQVYIIARTLENVETGLQYVMSDSIVKLRPGCHHEISSANQVPANTPPGRYRILGISQVQTTFRVVYVEWWTLPFQVTRGDSNVEAR